MLQAQNELGTLVIPGLLSKDEIGLIRSKHEFFCPECKEIVIMKAGEKKVPHFAHQMKSSCIYTGGESNYHMQGKLQLYNWLKYQYPTVNLEVYIPSIQQRPDILLEINKRKVAIEFQCSSIAPEIIRQRNIGYKKMNIIPIWILGAKRSKRIGRNKIQIDTNTLQYLQQFPLDTCCRLLYYCPLKHCFLKVSDPFFTNVNRAYANLTFHHLDITFPQLLHIQPMKKSLLYRSWLNEKQQLRIGPRKIYGSELTWRKWLYKKGVHVETLPEIIHLPISTQYLMKIPLWQWQSRFIIDFLIPRQINTIFSLKQVNKFLQPYRIPAHHYPLIHHPLEPGQVYLDILAQLEIIQQINPKSFKKVKQVPFLPHIEQSLRADEDIINRLRLLNDDKFV